MSAKATIVLAPLALLLLGSLLIWLQRSDQPATVQAAAGIVAGQSVRSVDGSDHLVERHIGSAGFFSLSDQLAFIGVTLFAEDRFTAIPDPALGVGSVIEIVRATPVTLIDGGETRELRTWAPDVEALLASQAIDLDADDRLEPDRATALRPDLVITITRVGIDEETSTEEIPFKSLTREDANLEKGTSRISQAGRPGLRKHTYRVTRENKQEVSRERIASEVVREPEDKITLQGTKTVSYGTGQATWYDLKSGFGAAHNTLPKGTRVKVTNLANGKSVDVVINDHGIKGSAIIDLTKEAFAQLAPLGAGRIHVRIEKDYD